MDCLTPPMFDASNIDMWKFKMSTYLEVLWLHVYLATIKKTYFGNDKYIEANTKVMEALRHTLSKEHLSLISHCDSTFAVWNTLTSPKEQKTNVLEKESNGDESNQTCFMVQGNDSHEVNSDTQLDDSASSSGDDHMDADAWRTIYYLWKLAGKIQTFEKEKF